MKIEILDIISNDEERVFLENTHIFSLNTLYMYGLNQLLFNKTNFNENRQNKYAVYSLLNLNR